MVAADGLLFLPVALWAAFALRLGGPMPPVLVENWWLLPAVALLTLPVFAAVGLYRAVVRYMGPNAVMAVIQGVVASALILASFIFLVQLNGVPRAVIALYALTALVFVGGSRFLARTWFQRAARSGGECEPVAIYGAGATGAQLVAQLMESSDVEPVVFFDDDPGKQGIEIRGVPVVGPKRLRRWVHEQNITRVLLAMPSASHEQRRHVVERLEPLPVHVQTVPVIADLLTGRAEIGQIRDVDVEDVLGRDAVVPDETLLRGSVTGRAVAVTGAGGSIGSELCRQIARLAPRRLILIEQNEYNLYRIEQELRNEAAVEGYRVEILPFLGSVEQGRRMERIFLGLGVETVYHAAAYKHVPIVEHNVIEGVRNNTFGTWRCAAAAQEAGVERFILVSTDKAVRPTNVMGASKRFAELVLQGMAREAGEHGGTCFSMVRFGNVLDSSGSVVPLFREQIRRGGPVTVTHPDVTRYFMTIPEAASLVLQAGTMAEGGDVFVLDMGDPVRIDDLARRLIRLSGRTLRDEETPDGQIAIEYVGLRPGEKLYEELLLGDNVTGTRHPMIMRAREWDMSWVELEQHLGALDAAARDFDAERVRKLLARTVGEYRPAGTGFDLLGLAEQAGSAVVPATGGAIAPLRRPGEETTTH